MRGGAVGIHGGYDVCCEWGERGVAALFDVSEVFVIVDVLSFSTSVDIAVSRGAVVYPSLHGDPAAEERARTLGAVLARPRGEARYSLSPTSYETIEPGARVVLPSPNGATLSVAAGDRPTIAGCLRNASAVARAALEIGTRVCVIPAGERWPDGSLRPCLEDWLGAGAIIDALGGGLSPEARAAAESFRSSLPAIHASLLDSVSGRKLTELGWERDVTIAAESDVSECVPILTDGAYVALGDPGIRR